MEKAVRTLLLAVCVGTDFETVVETRATFPSGGACHRQAGISSAVVSRTRTPDLYARVDCSPVQDLVPTSLLNTSTLPVAKMRATSGPAQCATLSGYAFVVVP